MFRPTTAIRKMVAMTKRIRVVQGSTSAGKTYGIIPILITKAAKTAKLKITVVCETVPAAREVANDIFLNVMQDTNRWVEERWIKNPMEYTFANGSRIQFKSFDTVGKAKASGKRDILFLNEANHISFEIADALMIRSAETWIDFNPTKRFWAHEEILPQPNAEFLRVTFEDNEALSPETYEDLMIKKSKAYYDPEGDLDDELNIKSEYWANWWRVYGLGEVGTLEGQIFTDIEHVNHFPKGSAVYGIDWGYTKDPTVLVKLKKHRGKLYRQQLFYRTNLVMEELIEVMMVQGILPSSPIIIDNDTLAQQALQAEGFNPFIAHKPAGSIEAGIQALKDIDICTTSDSRDLIKEEENYFWDTKDGKPTDKPIDAWNHGWDATRYAYDYILNPTKDHYTKQRKKVRNRTKKRRVVYAGR